MNDRAVLLHELPESLRPGSLAGATAVVIDLLRASTTITRAIASGADHVIPCLEPEQALAQRERLAGDGWPRMNILLGGERGGVLIAGFDLGNSPEEYTPGRVAGTAIAFTTTNGTRAIHAARAAGASRVYIGCLANLSAVVGAAHAAGASGASAPRAGAAVHLVCAGAGGTVAEEDVLCGGAIAAGLAARGWSPDAASAKAIEAWAAAGAAPRGVQRAMEQSTGGRNLASVGLERDIAVCAAIDSAAIVARVQPDGCITA